MAVTILESPQSFTPSDNELEWLISSDQFLQANFEFKIELYIDGVLSSVDKLFTKPNGVVKYNASELVKTTYQIPNINTDISVSADRIESTGTLKEVYIVATEVYGDPQAEEASATSDTVNVWKSSLSDINFIDFDSTDYIPNAIGKSGLTIENNWKYWVDIEKSNYLCFYNNASQIVSVTLRTFDASGTQIDQEGVSFGTLDKDVYIANISLKEWAIDTTDAVYYRVYIAFGIGTAINNSQIQKDYYINRPCISDRTVYFFNKLGGIDSQIFNKRKTSNRTFTRNQRTRNLTTINPDTQNTILSSKFRGRDINFLNQSQNSITLMSDWIEQDQIVWLVQELLESPLVWIEDENDNKIAYHVTNMSESEPQERYEELSQLVIDLQLSFKSKSVLF